MGLQPGDSVSTWITCDEAAESNILHLACYKAGLKLLTFSTGQDLDSALATSSALIFSPWEKHEKGYRIDHVLSRVPSLLTTPHGSLVQSSHKTKYFIQSSFKTIRGTYKLKTIPVYNGAEVANTGFDLTHQGLTVKNEELQSFIQKFREVLGRGVVVSSVPCKVPLAVGSLISSYLAGSKTLTSIMANPAPVVKANNANVFITTEEKLNLIQEPFNVDKVVLGVSDKEVVPRAVKVLEKKGVKMNKVLGFHSNNLSSLV
jgi:hypothetical protein